MAYSFANLSQAELDAFDGNISLALPNHRIRDASAVVIWGDTGTTSDTDLTLSGFPTSRIEDDFEHLRTQPDSNKADWFLIIDIPTPGIEFDSFVILNHNFGVNIIRVRLQIADNGAFTTNLRTIADVTPPVPTGNSLEQRIVELDLDHGVGTAQRYSGVEFARVFLTINGATAFVPVIGEVILSNRAQLLRNVLLSHDPEQQVTISRDFVARSGVRRRINFRRGQAEISAQILTADSTEFAVIDQIWSDTEQGSRPFMWINDPKNNSQEALFVHLDPAEKFFPHLNDRVRRGTWNMTEQGAQFVERER